MKDYMIEVTVDTNDADENQLTTIITEEELLLLRPLFEKVKNFKPYEAMNEAMTWTHSHNWPSQEQCREDLGEIPAEEMYEIDEELEELLLDVLPSCEYGFHTIVSVILYPAVEGEVLV